MKKVVLSRWGAQINWLGQNWGEGSHPFQVCMATAEPGSTYPSRFCKGMEYLTYTGQTWKVK